MLNKAMLIGNLGKDVEFSDKSDKNGHMYARFSIATTEMVKQEKQTEWHNIVCFGKLAELAQKFLKKGDRVYIEGKIRTESYEKDGKPLQTRKIICSEMKFLTPRGAEAPKNDASSHGEVDFSDIPF